MTSGPTIQGSLHLQLHSSGALTASLLHHSCSSVVVWWSVCRLESQDLAALVLVFRSPEGGLASGIGWIPQAGTARCMSRLALCMRPVLPLRGYGPGLPSSHSWADCRLVPLHELGSYSSPPLSWTSSCAVTGGSVCCELWKLVCLPS